MSSHLVSFYLLVRQAVGSYWSNWLSIILTIWRCIAKPKISTIIFPLAGILLCIYLCIHSAFCGRTERKITPNRTPWFQAHLLVDISFYYRFIHIVDKCPRHVYAALIPTKPKLVDFSLFLVMIKLAITDFCPRLVQLSFLLNLHAPISMKSNSN